MIKIRSALIILAVGCFLLVPSGHAASSVKALEISDQNASLLNHLESYPDLEVLSIACVESLPSLPDSIGKLTKLKELKINNGNGCAMNPVIPEAIGNLRSLEKLDLYGAQDPRGDGPQPKERHKFPRGMSQLKNLVFLDLGRNELDEIPTFVQDLPKLRELGFAWNMQIKEVPAFLSSLRELTTLDLDSDGLTDLPAFLNSLPKLTRITLGNNCKITQNAAKMRELKRKFPKIRLDFTSEYDCPAE
jgi:Leucine-rich repeat (LRR) protein